MILEVAFWTFLSCSSGPSNLCVDPVSHEHTPTLAVCNVQRAGWSKATGREAQPCTKHVVGWVALPLSPLLEAVATWTILAVSVVACVVLGAILIGAIAKFVIR